MTPQPHPTHAVPGGSSPIAGSVLPLQRAEELIATLQDVVSVRITPTESGSVDAIHVLVTGDTPAKQMVRNVESALMAQLGLRVDHRKISIAATTKRSAPAPVVASSAAPAAALPVGAQTGAGQGSGGGAQSPSSAAAHPAARVDGRPVYFEDVEVRGSRARGVTCKVTLRVGGELFAGESEEGLQSDRSRVEVAARAALTALGRASSTAGVFSLEGIKVVNAFEREFVFAAVVARQGRDQAMLTGSCEVRDSAETSAVLAVLDATNRWLGTVAAATGGSERRGSSR